MARVMKDSGVEWIGEVPASWSVIRFQDVMIKKRKKIISGLRPGAISFGRVVYKDDASLAGETKETYQEVLPNEILINPINLNYDLKSLRTALSQIAACVSPAYLVAKTSERASRKYVAYLLHVFDLFHMKTLGAGVRQTISFEDIAKCRIVVPKFAEQRRIAAWLDIQTGRIDKRLDLLGKKRELLRELRRNLIAEALSSGLNGQDKVQTGLTDLAELPKSWKASQAKRLLRFITSGSRGWAEYYADEGDIFLRIGNLTRESIELDLYDVQHVSLPVKATEGRRTRIRTDDMLVSITADLGSIAVAPKLDKPAYVNQHIALCRPKDSVHPRWLGYAMLSLQSKQQMMSSGYGGTKIQLSLDDVRHVWLAVPPSDEQREIADFLDVRLDKIARQITLVDQLEELLKEQRKAIIHEAVTGKIDLSSFEPPQQQEALAA